MEFFFIFFAFFFGLLSSSHAYTFNVGGRDGWTLHPKENYSQWSARSRFIVNDSLHFKYNGTDSVLEVNNADYGTCNTTKPITTLSGGDSFFTLNRSGPYYFISSNKSNCDQGQKLMVVVISPKTRKAPSPSGSSLGPSIASPPQPGTTMPGSPGSSPVGTGSGSSSPAGSPAASPGGSDSSSPSGGPTAMSPDMSDSPMYSPGGSPAYSPGEGPSASPMGNPADVNAPPPGSSAGKPVVSSTLSFSLAMIILGFGWFH